MPGSTCWSSMSCGMAPTIWMAIFTTSLGGGMAPAVAPHRRQFRVVAAAAASPHEGPGRRTEALCHHPSPGQARPPHLS